MECEAIESELDVRVACPPVSEAVPSEVPPSRKSTAPVGVPAPGATAATVAVKVTGGAKAAGLADEATLVELAALFTACVTGADDTPLKLPSPL